MNEKKPLIIALSVLALIILSGGGALYYFNFVVLPESMKALGAAKEQVAEAEKKQGKIKGFKDQIKDLKIQEEKKKIRIPDLDAKEYDALADLIDDIRKRAGVDVARGSYSLPKASGAPTTGVHHVQYELGVKGGFHQLLRYLNLIEKERRFLNVESFAIARGTDASTSTKGRLAALRDLKISITSYTYRQAPAVGGAVKPPPEEKVSQSTPVPE